MNKDEVQKLASLARIEISDDEAETLTHEFESILQYVGEVKGAVSTNNQPPTNDNFATRNVMREDAQPHESGVHTEDLLGAAPYREDQYVKVKQILG